MVLIDRGKRCSGVPFFFLSLAALFVLRITVGIKSLCIFYDATNCFGGSSPCIPRSGFQIRNDFGEKMEKLIGMRFLDISQLLRSRVANELCTSIFQKPMSC